MLKPILIAITNFSCD